MKKSFIVNGRNTDSNRNLTTIQNMFIIDDEEGTVVLRTNDNEYQLGGSGGENSVQYDGESSLLLTADEPISDIALSNGGDDKLTIGYDSIYFTTYTNFGGVQGVTITKNNITMTKQETIYGDVVTSVNEYGLEVKNKSTSETTLFGWSYYEDGNKFGVFYNNGGGYKHLYVKPEELYMTSSSLALELGVPEEEITSTLINNRYPNLIDGASILSMSDGIKYFKVNFAKWIRMPFESLPL